MTQANLPRRRLRDVVSLEKGKPPAQQPYFGKGAEPYLTPEYLRGGNSVEFVKPSANAVHVRDCDTIVLWDGSNAGEVLLGRAGVLASTMTRINYGVEFDQRYFFYALKQWDTFLKSQTSGSGIPHVDKEILENLEIVAFDQSEQSTIANILSTVDRAIEQTEALIAKHRRIKTGLMQDLFTRGIDSHGNLRSEKTHQFKDSPFGRTPKEWDVRSLAKSSSRLITYGIVQPGPNRPEGVPFVQTKDLMKGVLDINKMDRTSHEVHCAYQRSAVSTGDVLIGIRASVGSVLQVPTELNGTNISRGVARVSPSSAIETRYLYWILQSVNCQNAIALQIKGSTYPEITLPALRDIMIPIPLPAEQKQIAVVLDHAAQVTGEMDKLLSKIKRLKTALMQDLLTGRRRVTPLLSEPLEAVA